MQALRYDEALEDADSALAIDASFPKAFWRKGEALAALKRYPEALKAYKAGCALFTSILQGTGCVCEACQAPPTRSEENRAP